MSFRPDDKILTSGSKDYLTQLWSIPDGKLNQIIDVGYDAVNCVTFSPDGRILAFGTDDGLIYLYSMPDDNFIKKIETIYDEVLLSIAFSPDGNYMVAGLVQGNDSICRPAHIQKIIHMELVELSNSDLCRETSSKP